MEEVQYVKAGGSAPKVYLRGSVPAKRKIYVRDRNRNLRKIARDCMLRLAERKHLTTAISQAPVAAAGNVFALSVLSQGTSATTRVGQ